MSAIVAVAGGEAAVREAVLDAARDRGLEVRSPAEGEAPAAGETLVDLGLPPRDWPTGERLVQAEAERAARMTGDARVVRASVLGADAVRASRWQRAQFAAEEAHRKGAAEVVALRRGVLLGPVGVTGALLRAIQRSRIVALPAIRDAKLEPILLEDFARYCVEAAVAPGPLDDVYDLGCGEILTGGLLVRGLADSLGVSRWLVPVPAFLRPVVAAALATDEFPRPAVACALETIAAGFLARRVSAWSHFDVRPTELREALARATGMVVPVRKKGEGRFAGWNKPTKKGILWRKSK